MTSDAVLDITNQICPMTFVRTKLAIEKLPTGGVLDVRLKGEEPLKNVPRSVREHGHTVVFLKPETSDGTETGVYLLRIQKA